jgi:four helix bundle protein
MKTLLQYLMKLSYDLEERTALFGEAVIEFCLRLNFTPISSPLVNQIVRSGTSIGTSIGANYCEADEAESKPDFRHKIALCRKETRETKHWCRMLAKALPSEKPTIRNLWRMANELHLIFCKIVRTTDTNLRLAHDSKKTSL